MDHSTSSDEPVDDAAMPTIHLWNPIVGTRLLSTIEGGSRSIHLPASLVAGLRTACSPDVSVDFLWQLTVTATRTPEATPSEDVRESLKLAVAHLDLPAASAPTLNCRVVSDSRSATVSVVADTAFESIDSPNFSRFTPAAGWSSKTEGLWEPRRSATGLPFAITSRIGGRPGWSAQIGLDVRGEPVRIGMGVREDIAGWPLVVVTDADTTNLFAVMWDVRDVGAGIILTVTLAPAVESLAPDRGSPELTVTWTHPPTDDHADQDDETLDDEDDSTSRIARRDEAFDALVEQLSDPLGSDEEADEDLVYEILEIPRPFQFGGDVVVIDNGVETVVFATNPGGRGERFLIVRRDRTEVMPRHALLQRNDLVVTTTTTATGSDEVLVRLPFSSTRWADTDRSEWVLCDAEGDESISFDLEEVTLVDNGRRNDKKPRRVVLTADFDGFAGFTISEDSIGGVWSSVLEGSTTYHGQLPAGYDPIALVGAEIGESSGLTSIESDVDDPVLLLDWVSRTLAMDINFDEVADDVEVLAPKISEVGLTISDLIDLAERHQPER